MRLLFFFTPLLANGDSGDVALSPYGDIYLVDFKCACKEDDLLSPCGDRLPLLISDFSQERFGRLVQSAEKYNDLFSGMEIAILLQLLIHLFMIAPLSGELIKPE